MGERYSSMDGDYCKLDKMTWDKRKTNVGAALNRLSLWAAKQPWCLWPLALLSLANLFLLALLILAQNGIRFDWVYNILY